MLLTIIFLSLLTIILLRIILYRFSLRRAVFRNVVPGGLYIPPPVLQQNRIRAMRTVATLCQTSTPLPATQAGQPAFRPERSVARQGQKRSMSGFDNGQQQQQQLCPLCCSWKAIAGHRPRWHFQAQRKSVHKLTVQLTLSSGRRITPAAAPFGCIDN